MGTKDRPILFSAEMVRAILDGRKSQTRRVIKHLGNSWHNGKLLSEWSLSKSPYQYDGKKKLWRWVEKQLPQKDDWIWEIQSDVDDTISTIIKCPYGKAGDRLWVKEGIKHFGNEVCKKVAFVEYKDGGKREIHLSSITKMPQQECWWKGESKWTSSIFMPKWAARIWLEIINIRVERVQEITAQDAAKEGVIRKETTICNLTIDMFQRLWDSLNAKRGFSWDSNPFVWIIEFKRIEMPTASERRV